ncbi:Cysteine desulfurase [Lentibacillus sp. JNUCC-1]|uniref:cysteine desulfurase family protein n=1 Tax=Lentibacillus sp. JNUCC-1 TaxID=2654513 RepID=UPI0012E7A59B|nr:cysteine desulfurase family protein [Lentibacillus sp. JNUCC-1]MUV39311.1 Cysteine desulfurase [Lentibacillus sp. JNUCC-1]
MIYLDNSATTKPHPSVIKSFEQSASEYFANPSSIHAFGGTAEKLLQQARQQIADLIGVKPTEIVFTSGGTEANNTAIKGIALKHQSRGRHIITTSVEHPSVREACQALEELGFEVTYLPVDHNGVVSADLVQEAIRKETILISVMHVNNETGAIQPVEEIREIVKQHPKIFFHVDDVQGFGKVPLNLSKEGIDLAAVSGHKIHGLKGTGLLYVREGTTLFPLLHGGSQEHAKRAGTENVPGVVSLAKAVRLVTEMRGNHLKDLYEIHEFLYESLKQMPEIKINTPEHSAPHIINISTPWAKPEVLVHVLDERGIYISTKSACSSKEGEASPVLLACGHDTRRAQSSVRISLTYETTKEEVRMFLKALQEALNQLKKVMK